MPEVEDVNGHLTDADAARLANRLHRDSNRRGQEQYSIFSANMPEAHFRRLENEYRRTPTNGSTDQFASRLPGHTVHGWDIRGSDGRRLSNPSRNETGNGSDGTRTSPSSAPPPVPRIRQRRGAVSAEVMRPGIDFVVMSCMCRGPFDREDGPSVPSRTANAVRHGPGGNCIECCMRKNSLQTPLAVPRTYPGQEEQSRQEQRLLQNQFGEREARLREWRSGREDRRELAKMKEELEEMWGEVRRQEAQLEEERAAHATNVFNGKVMFVTSEEAIEAMKRALPTNGANVSSEQHGADMNVGGAQPSGLRGGGPPHPQHQQCHHPECVARDRAWEDFRRREAVQASPAKPPATSYPMASGQQHRRLTDIVNQPVERKKAAASQSRPTSTGNVSGVKPAPPKASVPNNRPRPSSLPFSETDRTQIASKNNARQSQSTSVRATATSNVSGKEPIPSSVGPQIKRSQTSKPLQAPATRPSGTSFLSATYPPQRHSTKALQEIGSETGVNLRALEHNIRALRTAGHTHIGFDQTINDILRTAAIAQAPASSVVSANPTQAASSKVNKKAATENDSWSNAAVYDDGSTVVASQGRSSGLRGGSGTPICFPRRRSRVVLPSSCPTSTSKHPQDHDDDADEWVSSSSATSNDDSEDSNRQQPPRPRPPLRPIPIPNTPGPRPRPRPRVGINLPHVPGNATLKPKHDFDNGNDGQRATAHFSPLERGSNEVWSRSRSLTPEEWKKEVERLRALSQIASANPSKHSGPRTIPASATDPGDVVAFPVALPLLPHETHLPARNDQRMTRREVAAAGIPGRSRCCCPECLNHHIWGNSRRRSNDFLILDASPLHRRCTCRHCGNVHHRNENPSPGRDNGSSGLRIWSARRCFFRGGGDDDRRVYRYQQPTVQDADDDDDWETASETSSDEFRNPASAEASTTAQRGSQNSGEAFRPAETGYFIENGVRRPIEEATVGWPPAHQTHINTPAGHANVHDGGNAHGAPRARAVPCSNEGIGDGPRQQTDQLSMGRLHAALPSQRILDNPSRPCCTSLAFCEEHKGLPTDRLSVEEVLRCQLRRVQLHMAAREAQHQIGHHGMPAGRAGDSTAGSIRAESGRVSHNGMDENVTTEGSVGVDTDDEVRDYLPSQGWFPDLRPNAPVTSALRHQDIFAGRRQSRSLAFRGSPLETILEANSSDSPSSPASDGGQELEDHASIRHETPQRRREHRVGYSDFAPATAANDQFLRHSPNPIPLPRPAHLRRTRSDSGDLQTLNFVYPRYHHRADQRRFPIERLPPPSPRSGSANTSSHRPSEREPELQPCQCPRCRDRHVVAVDTAPSSPAFPSFHHCICSRCDNVHDRTLPRLGDSDDERRGQSSDSDDDGDEEDRPTGGRNDEGERYGLRGGAGRLSDLDFDTLERDGPLAAFSDAYDTDERAQGRSDRRTGSACYHSLSSRRTGRINANLDCNDIERDGPVRAISDAHEAGHLPRPEPGRGRHSWAQRGAVPLQDEQSQLNANRSSSRRNTTVVPICAVCKREKKHFRCGKKKERCNDCQCPLQPAGTRAASGSRSAQGQLFHRTGIDEHHAGVREHGVSYTTAPRMRGGAGNASDLDLEHIMDDVYEQVPDPGMYCSGCGRLAEECPCMRAFKNRNAQVYRWLGQTSTADPPDRSTSASREAYDPRTSREDYDRWNESRVPHTHPGHRAMIQPQAQPLTPLDAYLIWEAENVENPGDAATAPLPGSNDDVAASRAPPGPQTQPANGSPPRSERPARDGECRICLHPTRHCTCALTRRYALQSAQLGPRGGLPRRGARLRGGGGDADPDLQPYPFDTDRNIREVVRGRRTGYERRGNIAGDQTGDNDDRSDVDDDYDDDSTSTSTSSSLESWPPEPSPEPCVQECIALHGRRNRDAIGPRNVSRQVGHDHHELSPMNRDFRVNLASVDEPDNNQNTGPSDSHTENTSGGTPNNAENDTFHHQPPAFGLEQPYFGTVPGAQRRQRHASTSSPLRQSWSAPRGHGHPFLPETDNLVVSDPRGESEIEVGMERLSVGEHEQQDGNRRGLRGGCGCSRSSAAAGSVTYPSTTRGSNLSNTTERVQRQRGGSGSQSRDSQSVRSGDCNAVYGRDETRCHCNHGDDSEASSRGPVLHLLEEVVSALRDCNQDRGDQRRRDISPCARDRSGERSSRPSYMLGAWPVHVQNQWNIDQRGSRSEIKPANVKHHPRLLPSPSTSNRNLCTCPSITEDTGFDTERATSELPYISYIPRPAPAPASQVYSCNTQQRVPGYGRGDWHERREERNRRENRHSGFAHGRRGRKREVGGSATGTELGGWLPRQRVEQKESREIDRDGDERG
ncbi:hypothetical protein OHC33_005857 [Knufia fluminis]|uniref:Uncharacterized protein n=1 Tax=Knufia fluminis TaxID=191047 RepID=A0AAN8EDU3_9EURO|nr:hypothetical protein OHC33_005857 [Knufia fluminis]